MTSQHPIGPPSLTSPLLVTLDQVRFAADQVCSGISKALVNNSPQPSSNTLAAAYVTAALQLMIPIMSVILFGSMMMQRVAEYSLCLKASLTDSRHSPTE